MKRTDTTTSLWVVLGTLLLAGTAAYLFVNNYFDKEEFEFDTYGEQNKDYL